MRFLLLVSLVFAAGCGSIIDLPSPDAGRPCTEDTECVPNACCGDGTAAVHVLDGPDCRTVRCSGACPLAQVRCGCGLPLCRGGHCTVAVDPSCG